MKRKRGIATIIVFAVIVVALAYYSFGILKGTMAKDSDAGIKLGLDLAGGVSITYQIDEGQDYDSDDIEDTIYKLQRRVENYSSESSVYQVGDDRITVEIPGVTNANEILEELGSPGSLEFWTPDGETFMTGSDITDAQAEEVTDSTTGQSEWVVTLTLTDEAADTFYEVTSENIGEELPIIYDNEIISQPTVEAAISGGTAQISGMDSYEDAEELASQLRIGSLSLELTEMESKVVGAQLGSEAISTSIKAALIGVIIVMIFMIAVYWIPGIATAISLMVYGGIMLALLHIYDITLTLPGIAGIILSIGMAVDANVLIFSRIREETASGRPVEQAIKTGFKKAQTAILDSNITTLIAAAVLGWLGSGSVRGFAATLALGVVISMFTALLITRLLVRGLYSLGFRKVRGYGVKKERKPVSFLKHRIIFFIIPICVIVIGVAGMGIHAKQGDRIFNFSLEFLGGTSTTVSFDEDYTIEEIDEEIVPLIEEITGDANVQSTKEEDSTNVTFKTRTLSLDERTELAEVFEENYGLTEEEDITYENISSTVSSEMRSDAIKAIIVATILMLVYIWIRFRDPRFASAAVIALIHDVLILIAFYALSRTSVGTTFIAAMLTVVGYSINSTIVIFDRIREHLNTDTLRSKQDVEFIVNTSVTQNLMRTVNTNITSLIMLVVLAILGVSSIREFTVPLIVGLCAGVYSSLLVTSALWFIFRTKIGKYRRQYTDAPVSKQLLKKYNALPVEITEDGEQAAEGAGEESEDGAPKSMKPTYTSGSGKKNKKHRNKWVDQPAPEKKPSEEPAETKEEPKTQPEEAEAEPEAKEAQPEEAEAEPEAKEAQPEEAEAEPEAKEAQPKEPDTEPEEAVYVTVEEKTADTRTVEELAKEAIAAAKAEEETAAADEPDETADTDDNKEE